VTTPLMAFAGQLPAVEHPVYILTCADAWVCVERKDHPGWLDIELGKREAIFTSAFGLSACIERLSANGFTKLSVTTISVPADDYALLIDETARRAFSSDIPAKPEAFHAVTRTLAAARAAKAKREVATQHSASPHPSVFPTALAERIIRHMTEAAVELLIARHDLVDADGDTPDFQELKDDPVRRPDGTRHRLSGS
jgi:hypothetical protein